MLTTIALKAIHSETSKALAITARNCFAYFIYRHYVAKGFSLRPYDLSALFQYKIEGEYSGGLH